MSINLGILSGGKSSRFGSDKALIEINRRTFIENIIDNFKYYLGDIIISCPESNYNLPYKTVSDNYTNCGPMSGIYEIMKVSTSRWTFVVAVDMPYLDIEILKVLIENIDEDKDIIFLNNNGQKEPLCALYHESVTSKMESALQNKQTKMISFLKEVNSKEVVLPGSLSYKLRNINKQEDYNKYNTKAFTICGVKNSGKTTFIQKVIKEFINRNRKVSVLKHDGHEFDFNDQDRDTYLYRKVGADQVAISSKSRLCYTNYSDKKIQEMRNIIDHFQNIDILIMEGYKNSNFPKFEIIRNTISTEISCNKKKLLGIITDHPIKFHDVQFNLEGIKEFCNYIESLNNITIDDLFL